MIGRRRWQLPFRRRCRSGGMPAHRNQHFVPRVHLAPFSVGGAGSAINLLNIRSGRLIPNAPLRSQCARNYLYSPASDLRLEKLLQGIEGTYAAALRQLAVAGRPAIGDMINNLRTFAFIQHVRTDQAMQQRKKAEGRVYDLSFEGALSENAPVPGHKDKTDREFMFSAMSVGIMNLKYIEDLKHCIVENDCAADFVTSDDPAIMTNRFLKQKFGHTNFGWASSGVMLILPLTPRRLFLLYDGNVYTLPDKENGRLRLRRAASVQAFNALQYIKAGENIYFADWATRDQVAADQAAVASHRRDSWFTVQVFVRDDGPDGRERYRQPTSEAERAGAKQKLVQMAAEYPAPPAWPIEVKLRKPPRTFQNGSALGMIRKREWLTAEGRGEPPRKRGNPIYLPR